MATPVHLSGRRDHAARPGTGGFTRCGPRPAAPVPGAACARHQPCPAVTASGGGLCPAPAHARHRLHPRRPRPVPPASGGRVRRRPCPALVMSGGGTRPGRRTGRTGSAPRAAAVVRRVGAPARAVAGGMGRRPVSPAPGTGGPCRSPGRGDRPVPSPGRWCRRGRRPVSAARNDPVVVRARDAVPGRPSGRSGCPAGPGGRTVSPVRTTGRAWVRPFGAENRYDLSDMSYRLPVRRDVPVFALPVFRW